MPRDNWVRSLGLDTDGSLFVEIENGIRLYDLCLNTRLPEAVIVRPEDLMRPGNRHLYNCFLKTLKEGGALFPIYPLGFDGAEEAQKLGVSVSATQVRSNGAQLAEVGSLLENGTIKVVIDSTYPLAEASKAHQRADQGHIQGKIILTVN